MFSVGKHLISLKALLTTVFIMKQPKILKLLLNKIKKSSSCHFPLNSDSTPI